MNCTPTLPADDPKMWRRLIARRHPDAGDETFVWTGALRDLVCARVAEPPARLCPTSPQTPSPTWRPLRLSNDEEVIM
jgi:hypothetical protein